MEYTTQQSAKPSTQSVGKEVEQVVRQAVQALLSEKGIAFSADIDRLIVVGRPKDLAHGDYMTACALGLSKVLSLAPMVVAENIAKHMQLHGMTSAMQGSTITVVAPGFINITLSQQFFASLIQTIVAQPQAWARSTDYLNKKIIIEHSSPNLFKTFHVGHVMNNAIGESLVRIAQNAGATVTALSYPSDISLGIGKAVWVLQQDGGMEALTRFKQGSVAEIEYFGDCYVRGTALYNDSPELQPAIRALAVELFEKKESPAYALYLEAKKRNLAYFVAITQSLGSHFDDYIFESEAGSVGKEIVEQHTGTSDMVSEGKAVFEQSDNAIVYHGERDGLHTRVFINHEGNPTYEAKDLGLLSLKFARYQPDLSIFITDHEQQEYFKVVSAAAGYINHAWKEKTIHRVHGRMSFAGKKMSSRLGGVPSAQALLDTVYDTIAEKAPALLASDMQQSKQAIAVAALKFSILRVAAGKNMNFDPETSLSFEGDTGPYIQYSIVRARSVLTKAGYTIEQDVVSGTTKDGTMHVAVPQHWQTTPLEQLLAHFSEVIEQSLADWSPHHIAGYLLEVTQAFNSWYGNTKIIEATESPEMLYKLAIVNAFRITAEKGLYLLGISVPEKM